MHNHKTVNLIALFRLIEAKDSVWVEVNQTLQTETDIYRHELINRFT